MLLTGAVPSATGAAECGTNTDFREKQQNARRLHQQGKTAPAIEQLEAAYAACPSDFENARELVVAYTAAGNIPKARALAHTLIRESNTAPRHMLAGDVESAAKAYKAAAEQYQVGAHMDPSEANIFTFGMCLTKLDTRAAASILRYGVGKYPASVRLRVGLASALYTQGMADEGGRLLCETAKLAPSDPHPMEFLADMERIPQDLAAEVTARLADLHRQYPRDGLILFDYTMARSGRWSGDPDATPPHFVEALEEAIALNPKLPQAYFQLSTVYDRQDRVAEEVQALKKAIELDPRQERYHYRLAAAYRRMGNEQAARDEIKRFRSLHQQTVR